MRPEALVIGAAILIFGSMALEASISGRRERALRGRGAVEPAGDVYRAMQVAYPAAFLIILVEAWWRDSVSLSLFVAGALIWASSKALKAWVILSLGERWSFRVLVLPSAPLVRSGPYRLLRHPNYLAVLGELAGAAIASSAPIAGVAAIAGFALLLRRRIDVEERALGLR